MKIRLLAPDSKYPNLAIMKISSYHKNKGDDVKWYDHNNDFLDTDILYISKIFNFTDEPAELPLNDCKIYRGGTGYDIKGRLPDEIENITQLDWSLYPDCDYSIMFTTRGCIRKCKFCIVKKKWRLISWEKKKKEKKKDPPILIYGHVTGTQKLVRLFVCASCVLA